MSTREKIKDVYLDDRAMADYKEYGIATIEDRAIVGTYDGLKPVMRRILWAMHKMGLSHKSNTVKGARIVGETMGLYHPHGDKAIYDTAVNSTQIPQKLIDGQGNWGTMTEEAAAMRYTEARLSKYSDLVFFDKFYLPIMQFVSNYDGTNKEPVNLLTLLPNGLLNGNFGICPGVNTRTPAFTLKSMVKVLQKGLQNYKSKDKSWLSIDDCMELEWISNYGGHLVKNKENKKQLKQFYKTGVANVMWGSTYKLDEKQNAIRYDHFAPISVEDKASKLLGKVAEVKGVAAIEDDTKKTDPYKQAYMVRFVKTLKGSKRERAIAHVDKLFCQTQRLDVKVTDRVADFEADAVRASLRSITVPELLTAWLKFRLELEGAACSHWIKETEREIRWHQVMRLAIAKLDLIFKLVKDETLDDKALVKAIAEGIKVTEQEADDILRRNLRQLRKLEDEDLKKKIEELEKYRNELEERRKKPARYVTKHLDKLVKELT